MEEINMRMEIDLDNVKEFVNNKLPRLLTDNCTDFATCAFILQSVLEAIDTLENEPSVDKE